MAKKDKPLGAAGGAPVFQAIGTILFWGFWTPILYIIFAPWLSFAIVNYWPNPIFAGFFNAMASMGWLCVSVVASLWVAYAFAMGYYRQQQSRKKHAAARAAKTVP